MSQGNRVTFHYSEEETFAFDLFLPSLSYCLFVCFFFLLKRQFHTHADYAIYKVYLVHDFFQVATSESQIFRLVAVLQEIGVGLVRQTAVDE